MPVTEVSKDADVLTVMITAEFDAPLERVWRLWSDPRKLERWWGPPSYPATFVDHELEPGGAVSYYMAGPEGEKYHGWWRIRESEPPNRLRFDEGFADADGKPNPEMPTTVMTVTLSEAEGRSTMELESRFASREAMDQILAMGAIEGMSEAIGQIDGLLRESPESA